MNSKLTLILLTLTKVFSEYTLHMFKINNYYHVNAHLVLVREAIQALFSNPYQIDKVREFPIQDTEGKDHCFSLWAYHITFIWNELFAI